MAASFTKIVTHAAPHLDEIGGIWLLQTRGKEKFPGVSDATIEFRGMGGEWLDGLPPQAVLDKGIIALGVGGGMFDEHPGPHCAGKPDKCASDLVAEALGVADEPELTTLLRFIRNADLRAEGSALDIASTIKAMHGQFPQNPRRVIAWTFGALEAQYHRQKAFFRSQRMVKQEARMEEIVRGRRTLIIAIAQTDEKQFHSVAFTQGAAAAIKRSSEGNVQILTNKKFHLKLDRVARMLRIEEAEIKGQDLTSDLSNEGKIPGAEEWYYHKGGEMLLNGSISCPDVPPTKIDLERIIYIVKSEIY